jgi:HEAT repeat protein
MDNFASPEIADLVRGLTNPAADVRAAAAERLCRAGGDAVAAATDLVRGCGDEDDRVREWAAAALEELGAPPATALEPLAGLARDANPLVAYWAVTLLGRSGKDAATAVPALVACVDAAGDIAVRQRAAWALGKIGPAAAAARESLVRAAGDHDPRLSRLATEALATIGG